MEINLKTETSVNVWSADTNMDKEPSIEKIAMAQAIIKYCQLIKLVYPIIFFGGIIFVMVLYIIDQLSK